MGTVSIRWYGLDDVAKWEKLEAKGKLGDKRQLCLNRWRELATRYPTLQQIEVSGKNVSVGKIEYPPEFTMIDRRYDIQNLMGEWRLISFLHHHPETAEILFKIHDLLKIIFMDDHSFPSPDLQVANWDKVKGITDQSILHVVVTTQLDSTVVKERLEGVKSDTDNLKALIEAENGIIKVFVVYPDSENATEPSVPEMGEANNG